MTPSAMSNAHAEPLSEVRHLLRLEVIAVRVTNATYIDPLQYVTVWERTDQGVDAQLPVGAPILAPCRVKILAIEPGLVRGPAAGLLRVARRPRRGQGAVRRRADHRHRAAGARSSSRGRRSPATPVAAQRSSTAGRRSTASRSRARPRATRRARSRRRAQHADLAEQPWRERGALAPEVIKPR